ncbi:DUF2062 domain-containing protein [Rossellomorea aquimaris]|uniref:Uncharacterized protein DUF2062 n=1 Tax=Rossellomorea aquimaris TaxID=189382 RepID=A0A366F227_9BACI|nr:DUF2062 domain-containing protein [Rossellomorea aquimaris]RBP07755.1 uncharacterized protein DUF2062 [Rossellomorea aquimaris]
MGIPLFFYLNFLVGHFFYPIDVVDPYVETVDSASEAVGYGLKIGKAFFIGMVINIPLFGIFTYLVMNSIVRRYRENMLTFVQKKWDL